MKRSQQRRPQAATWHGQVTLTDDRVVDVRPLEPGDRQGLADAIRRLSDETRYWRFATAKPRMSERELDVLLDVGRRGHRALLAVDPDSGRGVGVVRYIQLPGQPNTAEIAATVADDWQGRGLGRAMIARLIECARDEGFGSLRASVLAANNRSIAMLLSAGFAPLPGTGMLREYELAL